MTTVRQPSTQLTLPAPPTTTYAVLAGLVSADYLPITLELVTDTVETSPLRLNTTLVKGDFERYDWT